MAAKRKYETDATKPCQQTVHDNWRHWTCAKPSIVGDEDQLCPVHRAALTRREKNSAERRAERERIEDAIARADRLALGVKAKAGVTVRPELSRTYPSHHTGNYVISEYDLLCLVRKATDG